jgi:uncharacterized membrane protein YfcA
MDPTTLQVIAIVFLATLVRGLTGFGNALVAMPLLALVIEPTVASPLVALTAIVMASLMLAAHWREVHIGSAKRLLIGSLPGLAIGLWFLTHAGATPVRLALAIFILCYSVYDLCRPRLAHLESERWAYLAGFASGIIGGACNANGPPIVIYGTMRGWSPERFRATLQGYFLPAGLLILVGHAGSGLWTREVFRLFAWSLPSVFLGILLGSLLAKRVKKEHFRVIIHSVLIASALMLLWKVLRTAR